MKSNERTLLDEICLSEGPTRAIVVDGDGRRVLDIVPAGERRRVHERPAVVLPLRRVGA